MLLAKSTFLKHRQSILEIIHKLPVSYCSNSQTFAGIWKLKHTSTRFSCAI